MGNTIHCSGCQFPLVVGANFCTKKDVFTALFALDYIENNIGADFNFTSKFGLEEIYRTFSTTWENGNSKTMAQWKYLLSREIALLQNPTFFGKISDKFFDS